MIKKLYLFLSVTMSLTFMSGISLAKKCKLTVEGDDEILYNVGDIKIDEECTSLKLTLKHVGNQNKVMMGHNWVLTLKSDAYDVAKNGLEAGFNKDFIKENDNKVVARTKLLGGGQEDVIDIDLTKLIEGEEYVFFCLFPAHYFTMRGKFIYR